MRSELNIEEIDNPKFNARIFLFVSWQCNKCTFLIVIYLVCSFYISKLCCVFPVLHVVPISPAPNIARSTSSASLPFVCRWGDAADANFSARFLRGFMGFSLQMRYYFFKNLPNLYINISKNRVIQLYSYRTYFIYLLLFLGVTLTPTCRVFIYIYIYMYPLTCNSWAWHERHQLSHTNPFSHSARPMCWTRDWFWWLVPMRRLPPWSTPTSMPGVQKNAARGWSSWWWKMLVTYKWGGKKEGGNMQFILLYIYTIFKDFFPGYVKIPKPRV